jgi:hypothetical protein
MFVQDLFSNEFSRYFQKVHIRKCNLGWKKYFKLHNLSNKTFTQINIIIKNLKKDTTELARTWN